MTTSPPTSNFKISDYSSLPYLNINASDSTQRTLELKELFEYQKLTIPPPPAAAAATTSASPDYYILNIKKQFICVKVGTGAGEKSRIYVKNPVIDEMLKDKLPLISISDKTIHGEIVFDENVEPTAKSTKNEDKTGLEIFTKVYQKIEAGKQPFFAEGSKSFQGGNKRGGTRKVGGSRSR
tara:strand:- start:10 stop:552 length:543 start_codon:yes stop_codon:yes gene_type:complete